MNKLLILGGNYIECDLVKRAKELGICTIVTDNHLDINESPAKQLADIKWNISWSDIENLKQRCIDEKVNGVLAGFSEFRVESMIKLCGELGFPSSLNLLQLDITRDKNKFKDLCRKYDVPVVKDYAYSEDKEYPVIIKPVDRAGSIGINVAYNDDEFETYYKIAESLSPTNSVIIEKFIDNGQKFDVYYYVQDGIPHFLGSSDTLICKQKEYAEILQKAWIFPSKHEVQYIEEYQTAVLNMIKGLKIENCYLTLSAFHSMNQFFFFEAGFRLSGELSYNWFKEISGINYLDCLICSSLSMESPKIPEYSPSKYSVILNMFGIDGKITKIEDNVLESLQQVKAYNLYVREGDIILNNSKVLKKIAMITLVSDKVDELRVCVDKILNNYDILSDTEESLIYEKVSSKEIF